MNTAYTRILLPFITAMLAGCILTACKQADTVSAGVQTADTALPEVQYIEPSAEMATSRAVMLKDVPLAFTNQLFPYDATGDLRGRSNLSEQLSQVVKNADAALQAAGTNLSALVRIHVYLKDDSLQEPVLRQLGALLPAGTRPAITFISGGAARPDILVSMDMVAVAPPSAVTERVSLFQAKALFRPANRADIAVLAPGRKLFISGQAEQGDNLSDATRKTMRNLFATLAYIGANAEDVVQVKAFINPIEDAAAIEQEIVQFFRSKMAPPIVSVEWLQDAGRAEIELIASAPADHSVNEAVTYYAPSWMKQATTFSRIVDVHKGGLVFVSGLYEVGEEDGEVQARNIFNTLTRVLKEAGSGYDHLVKASYYPSTEDGRKGLVSVRKDFYNPDKPPAASLIKVQGAGSQGTSLNVDWIGWVPD